MIRVYRFSVTGLKLLVIIGIILAGIAFGVGRLLTPSIADYREEIENWTSEALGQRVEIGTLKGSWQGVGPKLILRDLELFSEGAEEPQLRLEEVHIAIGLVESIKAGRPAPSRITIYAPKLSITRQKNGSVTIAGLKGINNQGDSSRAFLLPRHIEVQDGELTWQDLSTEASPLALTGVELTLRNDGNRHQLEGSLVVPGQPSSRLKLAADIQGELERADSWSADLYFNGRSIDLTGLLNRRLPGIYQFQRGKADLEIWARWEKGQMKQLEGSGDWRQFTLRHTLKNGDESEIRSLDFDKLKGAFHWRRLQRGWRLDLAGVQLQRLAQSWPETRITLLSRVNEQGKQQLTAGTSFARLEDINAIAWLLPPASPALNDALLKVLPHGDLTDIRLRYKETDKTPHWSASGQADAFLSRPYRGLPGTDNLSFQWWMNQDQGSLKLASKDVGVQFEDLFRAPLTLNHLTGLLTWKHESDAGWQLESKRLDASNHHISTATRVRIQLPTDTSQSPYLDLQTDFYDGDGTAVSHYLPTGIMPDKPVEWLDRGIVDGHVTHGSALFRGDIFDFPFTEKPGGVFETYFTVEDGIIDYQKGWPRLEKLTARIRFLNDTLEAWADKGKILDSQIRELHCSISDLANADYFRLDGRAEGPFADNLRILRESPLKEKFSTLVKGVEGSGTAQLAMDIALPLRKSAGPLRLKGRVSFNNNNLQFKEQDLALEETRGSLSFDQDHLYTDKLSGLFMGQKIGFRVSTPEGNPNATRVAAEGRIPSTMIAERFSDQPLLKRLKGVSDWRLQVDIPHLSAANRAAVPLVVSSNLAGTAIDLPAPLGKPPSTEENFLLSTDLGDNPARPLNISYSNSLKTTLVLHSTGADRPPLISGDVYIGSYPAQKPKRKGLALHAKLPDLQLDPWLEFIKAQKGDRPSLPIQQINLQLGKLQVGGTRLAPFKLALENRGGILKGRTSSNRFQGEIEIPLDFNKQPLRLTLERLDLEFDPESLPGPEDEVPKTDINPVELPAVEAKIKAVTINGKSFGPLQLISHKTDNGWGIDSLTLDSPQLQLSASGSWENTNGGKQKTEVNLKFTSPELGQLLENFKFAKNIEEGSVEFSSNINWPDNPLAISREQLRGSVGMQIGKGRFLNVNPGVGRIFGLLNIGALQRRLTLDFSDVFAKGFTFDGIEGDFTLDDGDAYTSNFTISGPSSTIDITGRTGLASEDFDQLVSVTPRISSSITMAGAIAGGPVVGAALYLAEKVMGKSIDRATKIQYLVTGSWEDPAIERKTQPKEEKGLQPGDEIFGQ